MGDLIYVGPFIMDPRLKKEEEEGRGWSGGHLRQEQTGNWTEGKDASHSQPQFSIWFGFKINLNAITGVIQKFLDSSS